jgi:transcriptional regulator with GAF, ATPase, and Fis domain
MTTREKQLADAFIALSDTVVHDFDVAEFLYTLAERCTDIFEADRAGVILSDPEEGLVVAASTDRSARGLELLELDLRSGPCMTCFESGESIHAVLDSETSRDRWPEFTRHARSRGIESVVALPLRLRDRTIGALNLFLTEGTDMPERDKRAAQSLADVATIGILNAWAFSESQVVQGQLQVALDSRVVIEQAKGMVAQELDVDDGEAFDLIRSYSRNSNRKLRLVSEQITKRELLPADLQKSEATEERH